MGVWGFGRGRNSFRASVFYLRTFLPSFLHSFLPRLSIHPSIHSLVRSFAHTFARSRTLKALKRALDKSRAEGKATVKALEAREREALKKQRGEYESAIARHLSFIDRLLKDKEDLTAKCDELTEQIKALEQGFQRSISETQRAHATDLAKRRENWAAQERVRREKWEKDKTAEIKKLTVQGLEPEIQRILDKHKEDCRRLEEGAAAELRAARKVSHLSLSFSFSFSSSTFSPFLPLPSLLFTSPPPSPDGCCPARERHRRPARAFGQGEGRGRGRGEGAAGGEEQGGGREVRGAGPRDEVAVAG